MLQVQTSGQMADIARGSRLAFWDMGLIHGILREREPNHG